MASVSEATAPPSRLTAVCNVESSHGLATDTTKSHLLRESIQAMNPKPILSGYYGPRGERLKYTVHEGALRLPAEALDIIENHSRHYPSTNDRYQLPAVDAVIRPSQTDQTLQVTQLFLEFDPTTNTSLTVARNTSLEKLISSSSLSSSQPQQTDEQRIRGGGENDDDNMDAEPMQIKEEPDVHVEPAADRLVVNDEPPPSSAPALPTAQIAVKSEDINPVSCASIEVPASSISAGNTVDADTTIPAGNTVESAATIPAVNTGESDTTIPAVTTVDSDAKPPTATLPQLKSDAVSTVASSESAVNPAISTTATTSTTTLPPIVQPPTTVQSSTSPTLTSAPTDNNIATIVPLVTKPAPQWEQNFIPGPNDEMQMEIKTPLPSWYNPDSVADLERSMLPEWFNSSASHRTPETYVSTREKIRTMSTKVGNRFITSTLVRRTIAGDAGSLHRLHTFLMTWSLINEDAINDSTPTAAGMKEEFMKKRTFEWNDRWRDNLTEAVVEEANNKRQKTIDWNAVADRVGNGVNAYDCEIEFLALPLEARAMANQTERSITPDVTSNGSQVLTYADMPAWLEHLVNSAKRNVVEAATAAALEASPGDLSQAQRGTLAALVITNATEKAREEEACLSRALEELHEQRLQKLENRFALMDDIECILEAERVALELERRDLYTARCRHWFGGGN